MTHPLRVLRAVGDDERLARNQQEMFESVQRFVDLSRIDVIPHQPCYDLPAEGVGGRPHRGRATPGEAANPRRTGSNPLRASIGQLRAATRFERRASSVGPRHEQRVALGGVVAHLAARPARRGPVVEPALVVPAARRRSRRGESVTCGAPHRRSGTRSQPRGIEVGHDPVDPGAAAARARRRRAPPTGAADRCAGRRVRGGPGSPRGRPRPAARARRRRRSRSCRCGRGTGTARRRGRSPRLSGWGASSPPSPASVRMRTTIGTSPQGRCWCMNTALAKAMDSSSKAIATHARRVLVEQGDEVVDGLGGGLVEVEVHQGRLAHLGQRRVLEAQRPPTGPGRRGRRASGTASRPGSRSDHCWHRARTRLRPNWPSPTTIRCGGRSARSNGRAVLGQQGPGRALVEVEVADPGPAVALEVRGAQQRR